MIKLSFLKLLNIIRQYICGLKKYPIRVEYWNRLIDDFDLTIEDERQISHLLNSIIWIYKYSDSDNNNPLERLILALLKKYGESDVGFDKMIFSFDSVIIITELHRVKTSFGIK